MMERLKMGQQRGGVGVVVVVCVWGGVLFACACMPVHVSEPTSVSTQLCCFGLFVRDIAPVLHHRGGRAGVRWGGRLGGQNIASISCCVICDPESQKFSIIDQRSSLLNHSGKSVNKPGDTCQLAELFGSSSPPEAYRTFQVKV